MLWFDLRTLECVSVFDSQTPPYVTGPVPSHRHVHLAEALHWGQGVALEQGVLCQRHVSTDQEGQGDQGNPL